MKADRYAMLASSLPHLGRLFEARERPLTRLQLERRLRLLEPEDAATLRRIENVLRWAVLAPGTTDAEQAGRARRVVAELREPTLREAVARRMEARTLVAALRRRRDRQGPPETTAELGYHRDGETILRRWSGRAFGLARREPWLAEAENHLRAGAALELEKLLLREAWRDLERLGRGHAFDFAAVALYVLKWDLMDRWMRYDAEAARARFDRIAEAALAEQADALPAETVAHG